MKNNLVFSFAISCAFLAASCSKDTTYADQKKAEKKAIESFIANGANIYVDGQLHKIEPINVIDDYTFFAQDSTTDLSKNQYVYFGNSGVYMQIVRKGVGPKIEEGETKRITARYFEYNIMADSVLSLNTNELFSTNPDILNVANYYGTFTASFSSEVPQGAMYIAYSSTEVPGGWLVPFTYIRVGRQQEDGKEISKVRIIVPHSQGTSYARNSVYPTFYEIDYQQAQ